LGVVSGVGLTNPWGLRYTTLVRSGLLGWTIQLVDAAGTTRSATTGGDGSYRFSDVGPGTYTIQEVQQTGWTQTAPRNPNTYTVTVSSDHDVTVSNLANMNLTTTSA